MMISEEEARKKWCPHARVWEQHGECGGGTNRHAGVKKGQDGKPRILRGNAMCIASECMAWRRSHFDEAALQWTGYCGLAGAP